MYLGSIYLIVRNFNKSVVFYEKLLEMKVTSKNMERFAQFQFEGNNISIMNGYFDKKNPELTIHKGQYIEKLDNLAAIADAENTKKFVLNFWVKDLEKERERIITLNISELVTEVKYVNNVMPYYYFQVEDPDGNVIEITGEYIPKEGEYNE